MLSRLHNQLGTAGFVIAIIALVAAMTGGAYAALSAGDKRVVKKEAKKFSNKFSKKYAKQFAKPGTPGAPGATGPQGPKGDKGDTGPKGDKGDKGDKGATGEKGATGDPWTAGGVLPAGETETGAWSTSNFAASPGNDMFDVSFTIPLANGSDYKINYIDAAEEAQTVGVITGGDEGTPNAANCPGTMAEPKALPGNLCLYADAQATGSIVRVVKEDEGAVLLSNLGEFAFGAGTWAVTAPTP